MKLQRLLLYVFIIFFYTASICRFLLVDRAVLIKVYN